MYEIFIAAEVAYIRSQALIKQAEQDRLFAAAFEKDHNPSKQPFLRQRWRWPRAFVVRIRNR